MALIFYLLFYHFYRVRKKNKKKLLRRVKAKIIGKLFFFWVESYEIYQFFCEMQKYIIEKRYNERVKKCIFMWGAQNGMDGKKVFQPSFYFTK